MTRGLARSTRRVLAGLVAASALVLGSATGAAAADDDLTLGVIKMLD